MTAINYTIYFRHENLEVLFFRTVILSIENITEQKAALRNGSADILLTPVVPTTQDLDQFNQTIPVDTTWYLIKNKFYFLHHMKIKELIKMKLDSPLGIACSLKKITVKYPICIYSLGVEPCGMHS
jgi:hypothetical protein